MHSVDPEAFEFAIGQITDGFVFEKFAQQFLGAILGYEFMPVGGVKDRGIDGLEHLFFRDKFERNVYQASIEYTCDKKLQNTIVKLVDNEIIFEQLYFVTNRVFSDKDKVIDELYEKYKKPIHIYDAKWMSSQINNSPGAVTAYHTFVESHLHQFQKPGKAYVVEDLAGDPSLFVFLRQQWDEQRRDLQIDSVLADALILYALEGTDPNKGIFRSEDQVKDEIAKLIQFDPKLLHATIGRRLKALSRGNARRIQYHKAKGGYCLPFDTRREIQDRNLKDAAIHEAAKKSMEQRLRRHLRADETRVRDCIKLIDTTIHTLFHRQGLEFADFVLKGQNRNAFEKHLPDVVSMAVDGSAVVPANKEAVKTAVLMTIRDVAYSGSDVEKEFLGRLSQTYMMLFLLQCDPKIAAFFGRMAAQLHVYVCTSILIPAMSEYFLADSQRRYWNLLKGARAAGVTLIVNHTIVDELATHFKKITYRYQNEFRDCEDAYIDDEARSFLVEDILIRAYFYAKRDGNVSGFSEFVDNFVNPNLTHPHEEIIEWLKQEFSIEYRSDESIGVQINKEEEKQLYEELLASKKYESKARNDARLILAIYGIRAQNNETDSAGIFGFRTWWLSSDTLTQKAVNHVFKDKYNISCYIRPDFLYNYVSLTPVRSEVDAAYRNLFPSLLGVNLSVNLPKDVIDIVLHHIREFRQKNPARVKSIMRDLVERLKTTPKHAVRQVVESFFEQKKEDLEPGADRTEG